MLIGDFGNGLLVLGLAGLAGFGFIGRSHPPTTSEAERRDWSDRLGNRLFLPALIIPARADRHARLQLHALGIRLDRGQARDLCLPRAWRAVLRRHLRLAEAPGNRAASGGPPADRRHRLGGRPAADARLARRAVRRGGRRRCDRLAHPDGHSEGSIFLTVAVFGSAWRSSPW